MTIEELKAKIAEVSLQHKDDIVGVGELNIHEMCENIIRTLNKYDYTEKCDGLEYPEEEEANEDR